MDWIQLAVILMMMNSSEILFLFEKGGGGVANLYGTQHRLNAWAYSAVAQGAPRFKHCQCNSSLRGLNNEQFEYGGKTYSSLLSLQKAINQTLTNFITVLPGPRDYKAVTTALGPRPAKRLRTIALSYNNQCALFVLEDCFQTAGYRSFTSNHRNKTYYLLIYASVFHSIFSPSKPISSLACTISLQSNLPIKFAR